MKAIDKYLSKLPEALVKERPDSNLGIVVTIPAYNEAETIKSLDALLLCDRPRCAVEVIVNVNFPEYTSQESKRFNEKVYDVLLQFALQNSTDSFAIHIQYFPNQVKKHAGVGLARKQVMDEAFRRLLSVGKEDGIITGFDADASCAKNYFTEIEKFFIHKPKARACSLKFQHDIEGSRFSKEIYDAITLYELHLRYFINAQKLIGASFAFQTVGSSFAVRAKNYADVNGMSPKKAGEDFYFLQKIIVMGEFYQLNTTCVYPSSRISNRVGFGTGPSVGEISQTGEKLTYNFKSFLEIKKIFDELASLYSKEKTIRNLGLTDLLSDYLVSQKADKVIENLIKNNKTFERFKNAFMQWFGGFQILKVLNILRASNEFEDIEIISQLNQIQIVESINDPRILLERIRTFDEQE